jgi:hypothetical protein
VHTASAGFSFSDGEEGILGDVMILGDETSHAVGA